MSENNSLDKNKSKPLTCTVTSASMAKSRVGTVDRLVKEGLYGKYIKRQTRVMFHDEEDATKVGDRVLVVQSRPRSKRKKFVLSQIIEKS